MTDTPNERIAASGNLTREERAEFKAINREHATPMKQLPLAEYEALRAERIAAIRARAEKATPGPWRVAGPREPEGFVEGHILCLNRDDPEHALDERVIAQTNYHYEDDADQQFIAHSRSDIPWLLAQLAERDAEIARLREGR